MGLMTVGTPETWSDTQKYTEYVRRHGIKQFINQYKKCKDRNKDPLYWGDEVEYMLFNIDEEKKTAKIALKASEVLRCISAQENKKSMGNIPGTWYPEYAECMVESIPWKPYDGLNDLNDVETNMIQRSLHIKTALGPNEFAVKLASLPRLGTVNYSVPEYRPTPKHEAHHSVFLPDQIICSSITRFKTVLRNMLSRREDNIAINIPVYMDKLTKSPYLDDAITISDNEAYLSDAIPGHIYLDSASFGMGTCNLHVTLQCCNITEAMRLYDELCPISPVMLALCAAAPYHRGYLADIDSVWPMKTMSYDDRTREERGVEPLKHSRLKINKSRFDTIDCYLSACHQNFNDIEIQYDPEIYEELVSAGVDAPLSKHVANLFIRDILCLYKDKLHLNDDKETYHFEVIHTSNWKNLRLKLPPPENEDIGWRIEFRPMEVQLTDFENAAFVVFMVLLTRVVLSYNMSFVMPISKVDENVNTAGKRDAVLAGKFHFRKDICRELTTDFCCPCKTPDCQTHIAGKRYNHDVECTLMTIDQIINGSDDFPGLVPLIHVYITDMDVDVDTRRTLTKYLEFISKRASGEIPTNAKWLRDFVLNHDDYKHDSVVSEIINFDLIKKCVELQLQNQSDIALG